MRHEIESPFSFGDTKRTRLVRRCAAMPHRIESPFSFRLAEKKTAIHGQKKRRLGMSWPLTGQLTNTKERPVRTAMQTPNPPTGCVDKHSLKNCPRICGRGVHWGANRTPSASFSAAAPLILRGVSKGEGRSRSPHSPSHPWGWFPKAGAEAPAFVSLGVQGESKRPGAFLPGCGAGSFPEKNAPHVPVVGTTPCGSRGNWVYFMKYPPGPKIWPRFPQYGPSGPEDCPPAAGQRPLPCAPRPPA